MQPTQINPRDCDVIFGIDVDQKSNAITYRDPSLRSG